MSAPQLLWRECALDAICNLRPAVHEVCRLVILVARGLRRLVGWVGGRRGGVSWHRLSAGRGEFWEWVSGRRPMAGLLILPGPAGGGISTLARGELVRLAASYGGRGGQAGITVDRPRRVPRPCASLRTARPGTAGGRRLVAGPGPGCSHRSAGTRVAGGVPARLAPVGAVGAVLVAGEHLRQRQDDGTGVAGLLDD